MTALNKHGILSQIPQQIQIASTGRSRSLQSPVANYEFIQLSPAMFAAGFDWTNTQISYLLASPEKALLDTLFERSRKPGSLLPLDEVIPVNLTPL